MDKLNLDELSQETLQGLTLRGKLSTEKVFSLNEVGINSKIFHVWKSKGLVDFILRGKWSRFTFVEYVWLRVLETMRNFGCSVKLMKELYDYFFTRAYNDNLAEKNFSINHEYYKNLSKTRPLTEDEADILDMIEYILQYPVLQIGARNESSYFYNLILDCLKYQTEAGIVIYEDGTFTEFLNPPYKEKKGPSTVHEIPKPHLYIPISSYILEFVDDEKKEIFLIKSGLLSEDEYRVVREIRNKNVKSITITFNDIKHTIEKIECDKKGQLKGDEAKKIMKLLGLKNYSGIQLNTRDGKTLSFTRTDKKFF